MRQATASVTCSWSWTAPLADRRVERPPLNVSFILDRSGSMGGEKIALAREAVIRALSLLDDRDRFSVVAYDDAIDVVGESTPASAEAKGNALQQVRRIDARGSTNLAGGWAVDRPFRLVQGDLLGAMQPACC